MNLYSRLSDLSLVVEGYDLSIHERETTSDFTRTTTVIRLHGTGESDNTSSGTGESGYGEDVTYESDHH